MISKETHQFSSLLPAKGQKVMGFIPLPKGCGINHHNSVLHQCLSTHQLIVGCIVDHIYDTALASGGWNMKEFKLLGVIQPF